MIMVQNTNFGRKQLGELERLKAGGLGSFGYIECIFPKFSVCLWMFLTAPATEASAEMSFTNPKLLKNYIWSIIG